MSTRRLAGICSTRLNNSSGTAACDTPTCPMRRCRQVYWAPRRRVRRLILICASTGNLRLAPAAVHNGTAAAVHDGCQPLPVTAPSVVSRPPPAKQRLGYKLQLGVSPPATRHWTLFVCWRRGCTQREATVPGRAGKILVMTR